MVHVQGEVAHAEDLKEEIQGRQVDEAEEKQPEGTEIKCEQSIQEDDWQRLLAESLAEVLRDVVGRDDDAVAVFLAQTLHQQLELWCGFLLGLGIANVAFLEPTLIPGRLCCHLIEDLLLAARGVELAALLSL